MELNVELNMELNMELNRENLGRFFVAAIFEPSTSWINVYSATTT
jgi:hypothetical protein